VAAVRGFTKHRDTVAPALWPACFSEADSSDALLLRTGTRRTSPQIDRDLLTPLPEHLAHLVTLALAPSPDRPADFPQGPLAIRGPMPSSPQSPADLRPAASTQHLSRGERGEATPTTGEVTRR
jgi:hypothetical protein